MRTDFPERLIKLAECFPALHEAPACGDPEKLWEWAQNVSSGEFHAAVFILNVWNFIVAEPIGIARECWPRFDLFAAIGVWDGPNTEAFQAWARKPWCA